jgi:ATP-binding cassette, subfamily B, bacterial PglK
MIKRSLLIKLWKHLSIRRKKQFWLILILMIAASLMEVISVGAILPFLGVLTAPEQVYQHPLAQPIVQYFQLTDPDQLILPLSVIFIVAALFAGLIRLFLLYTMTRFSYATGADISFDIYYRTLHQRYSIHVGRNSSEVINGIITKINTVINGVISPTLTLVSSLFFIVFIVGALFTIDPVVAFSGTVGFGLLYWLVIYFSRHQILENSQCIAKESNQMIKSLQEGLGGIRDVLIDGSQQFYCQLYRDADIPFRKASGMNEFISGSPRFVMEAVGMSLIAGLAYTMSLRETGLVTAIPVLGALALGAQRLLPALQQAYSSYSTIKGVHSSFHDVLSLLNQSLPRYAGLPAPTPIPFNKEILLENISFYYDKQDRQILDKINLVIPKGSRIGFIGKTGSGKSTLIDIFMGLLSPTGGKFFVDQQLITIENCRSWQAHIAHVPQNIYLSDGSIEENIAFGTPKDEINHQRVREVAQQAQISGLIDDWKDGYQTFVGERGVRLSGGQRQRIGIARALYKKADILVLDEATSSLDNETEQEIMNEINDLGRGLTILIIAHRLTTLKDCDKIVKLSKDNTIHILNYEDVMELDNKQQNRKGLC